MGIVMFDNLSAPREIVGQKILIDGTQYLVRAVEASGPPTLDQPVGLLISGLPSHPAAEEPSSHRMSAGLTGR
jgi:hypothetical protein